MTKLTIFCSQHQDHHSTPEDRSATGLRPKKSKKLNSEHKKTSHENRFFIGMNSHIDYKNNEFNSISYDGSCQ